MPEVPAPVTALARKAPAPVKDLARRSVEPVVTQTLRSTSAAVISYVLAVTLLPQPAPLTAPLTALLVVQVTLFATIRTGIRRVNAVIAGVLIASGFSSLVGLTWWSLGLTIVTALVIGRIVRVGEFVPEVAISAMLVLGVSQVANTALDRVYETLIGAGVGLAFNLFLAPPVYVRTANEAITAMARRSSRLYNEVALQVGEDYNAARAADWLHAARRLDNDIAEVDEELRQAEESTRLNPRVREGLLNRVVLRTGLDTLEICAVVQRVQFRTLTDLAAKRPGRRPLPEEAADSYARLLLHMGSAVESFAALITTPCRRARRTPRTRSPARSTRATPNATTSRRSSSTSSAPRPRSGSSTAPCSPRPTASSTNSTSRSARPVSSRNSTASRPASASATPGSPPCARASPAAVRARPDAADAAAGSRATAEPPRGAGRFPPPGPKDRQPFRSRSNFSLHIRCSSGDCACWRHSE